MSTTDNLIVFGPLLVLVMGMLIAMTVSTIAGDR